ncbi:MAG: hypothetical protein WD708_06755 [Kiritimatiellia bacterium]
MRSSPQGADRISDGNPAPSANADTSTGAASSPLVAQAQSLYNQQNYEGALTIILRAANQNPGAADVQILRNRILSAMLDERAVQSALDQELNRRKASQDALDAGQIPDTFGKRRQVEESATDKLGIEGPVLELLSKPVSLHLSSAPLSTLIRALSEDDDINMIADPKLGNQETLDIQATDVPLREVLDYLSRHFQVQFHTGQHMIWVTTKDPDQAPPMETRIYRLRTGLLFHGLSWGTMPEAERLAQSDLSALTRKATVLPHEPTHIQKVLEEFVPSGQGAQLHVDLNSHTLFARNTPENLNLIEEIVRALDTTPPQVLIEARFIEISQSDLREIGIDWILGSPLSVSTKGVLEDGVWRTQPRTVVDEASSITYEPYRSDSAGSFPLGPQGAFGLLREGNPPTDSQGLNLTYRGLLTEPMFNAVLHALEISGKGRTLSVPRVTTLNNNPAKLRDGDDLLYYEEFEAQAFALVDEDNKKYTVTALIPKGTPKTAELGFTLVAVPSVGADNRSISLLLSPTISELLEFISYQEDGPREVGNSDQIRQVVVKLPRIARREVQTKVVVESGETVVMGGLIRTISQDTVRKVPILGSLPLIGNLFKRTDTTEERRNLIIFVTATVISERGESLIPHATTEQR